MIHIAIIDTYVKEIKIIGNRKPMYHYKIKRNKVIKDRKKYIGKVLNHGCICYQILYENSVEIEYSLHCIKVIEDKESKGDIKKLMIALEWCLQNKIQIISLSIGTRSSLDGELLKPVLWKLYEMGVIVIAAFNNQNTLTYPAAFDFVIGVCIDNKSILPLNSFIYLEKNENNIDIIAQYNIKDLERRMGIQIGEYNSYVVPFIVSEILKIKAAGNYVSSKNIREYLKEYSVKL